MAVLKLATTIKVGVGGIGAAAVKAAAYEDVGVDVISVGEAYGCDAVSILGYLSAKTQRVELATQILPVYSRTPTMTAMTAMGLDIVSEGRFILGLGVSGPQVVEGWHGVPYDAPLGRTREVVEICRKIWRRERLTHDGPRYRIPLPVDGRTGLAKPLKVTGHPIRPRIPVYIAALGPANVEMTASIADGWVPFMFMPERAWQVWGSALKQGNARRPPDLGPLQVVAGGPMAIGEDVIDLREQDRDRMALYLGGMGSKANNYYNRIAQTYGFVDEAIQVQDLYLAGQRAAAAKAVPDGLLEGTSLIGDERYVSKRLSAYVESGVTVLEVDPVGEDPIADLARLRTLIDALS